MREVITRLSQDPTPRDIDVAVDALEKALQLIESMRQFVVDNGLMFEMADSFDSETSAAYDELLGTDDSTRMKRAEMLCNEDDD